jgi:hypothetical protein
MRHLGQLLDWVWLPNSKLTSVPVISSIRVVASHAEGGSLQQMFGNTTIWPNYDRHYLTPQRIR